jgi:uncharacterized membrane protein YoaK (UPF0700 family)
VRTSEASQGASATRYRDVLVVILTLTTGALDAVTYLRLGKVFSSVITGNLALLGIAVGEHRGTLALNGGLALAGYAFGVLTGGIVAGTPQQGQPVWPVQVTATLAVELAVLVTFGAEWLAAGSHPAGPSRLALLMLAAVSMGMQSTAVRRLGRMSTTYLTSTLTGFLTALSVQHWPSEWWRSAGVLVTLAVGATFGALSATFSPSLVPAAVLVPAAAVLACSLTRGMKR